MKNSKAILQVPGTMKIISAEIPVPKEDEVLIKVEYVGICGSDVHGFESGPFIPPKDPNQRPGRCYICLPDSNDSDRKERQVRYLPDPPL